LIKLYKNKVSSLSLLSLRIIYRNQVNTDSISSMIFSEYDLISIFYYDKIDKTISIILKYYTMSSDMIIACQKGDLKQVELLLMAGANPNQTDRFEEISLHYAVHYDCLEIAELLLKAGANPNQTDIWGSTPLHWAAQNNNLEIVELLLKAGTDPNQADECGNTPLRWAVDGSHSEIIELLKSYENKVSSLSLLCLRTIYRNQINTDNIPNMILEWNFYQ